MPATTEDILVDEDFVTAEIQETTEQRNVFSNAFRNVGLSLADPETVYFLVSDDRKGQVEVVPEGGEFPRDMEERRRVPCTRTKFGEEYSITREAAQGGLVDDMAIEARNKMQKIARTMDAKAYEALADNLNEEGPIGANDGELGLEDIADAETFMLDDPFRFEPNALFTGPQGLNDLRKGEWLDRDTDLGDDVRTTGGFSGRTGQVGTVMGIPVYVSNAGQLGAGEAILVDTNYYGRNGVWEEPTARSYSEEKTQTDTVMQMWTHQGWCSIEPNAAVKIEG